MNLMLQTPPTLLAVSVADAKLHLHVDEGDEDTLIAQLVVSATTDAENLMQRAVMPQQWVLTLDAFEDEISLSRPKVIDVESIKYIDSATGALTTLASTEYQVAKASEYTARVVPAYGKAWPAARQQLEAVQIAFSCGYPDAARVPAPITQWIKMRLGALYAQREAWTLGQKIEHNEFLDYTLDHYTVRGA